MKTVLMIAAFTLFPMHSAIAQEPPRISLDAQTQDRCLKVLRAGLHGDEFWPSMHAAEALTLGGYSTEVIEFLTPKLKSETDDQHLCGIAREIARAGDRSSLSVMLNILQGANNYGHVHAAESLFKVFEIGDGVAMRKASAQNDNLKLKVMAAGALVRSGDAEAIQIVRDLLNADDFVNSALAAWVLGQIGDDSDIPRLQSRLAKISNRAMLANVLI